MNNNEARVIILEIITEKVNVTAGEINYISKIPLSQIYTVAKKLMEENVIVQEQKDNNKFYCLSNTDSVVPLTSKKSDENPIVEKLPVIEQEKEKATKNKINKGGRDLTKYTFNGVTDLSKGRLALAIFVQYAKDKRPSLKAALDVFSDEIVPPYGFIKPVAEAKAISKQYLRFFIKPEEEVKLKDCSVCVSNQMNSERIEQIIAIARKELGYKIK